MSATERLYFDTSALLPYYREEAASPVVQEILLSVKPPVVLSELTKVEFSSALGRWFRMGEISETQAEMVERVFAKDIAAGLFLVKPVTSTHYRQAEKWLSRRSTALRTLDALHLACCVTPECRMVTSDAVLHQAALTFGLRSRLVHLQ